jgi:hypothetical protein
MGFFRKKNDPISEKARALNQQIEALEAEIKRLSEEAASPQPRFRSSTMPRSAMAINTPSAKATTPRDHFEDVDHTPLQSPEPQPKPEQQSEMGVRKYDLGSVWQRLKNSLKTPPASNPKLVNYLAAGSIQGLRPLRYEKRVARNRFVFLVIVLLLMLWGILAVLFQRS